MVEFEWPQGLLAQLQLLVSVARKADRFRLSLGHHLGTVSSIVSRYLFSSLPLDTTSTGRWPT